jgi:hypothetical protein
MLIEEIGAEDLARLASAGRVDDVVAVGLAGAWAVNIVSDARDEDALTLRPSQINNDLHARYFPTLAELDHFLQDLGIVSYTVDRSCYARELPAQAFDREYFPSGPEEFLDHEFVSYLRKHS